MTNILASFLAYKKKMGGETDVSRIYGYEKYTPEQIFFIGYGIVSIKRSFIIFCHFF
jgi:hypothetical protein